MSLRSYLKTFLKFCLALLFIVTIPVFSLCLALKLNHFSAEMLKQLLIDRKVYLTIYTEMVKTIETSKKESNGDDPLVLIGPFLKKEVTAEYIQQKTEQTIDDSQAWVTGKTTSPPVISFSDLKEKLVTKNAKLIAQLKELEAEYKKEKPKMDAESEEKMPEINFSDWLEKEPVIPLVKYIGWLKPVYQLVQYGTIIFGLLLFVYLVGMMGLSASISAGLKWLVTTVWLAAGWLALVIYALGQLFTYGLTRLPPEASVYIPLDLVTQFYQQIALVGHYVVYGLMGLGGLGVVVIVLRHNNHK
jgi:hypothetical protein